MPAENDSLFFQNAARQGNAKTRDRTRIRRALSRKGQRDTRWNSPQKSPAKPVFNSLTTRVFFNMFKSMKRTIFLPYLTFILTFVFITCVSVPSSHAQGSQSYKVGDTGPAGGIVFYDKGDNSDGWQYLEAAPAEFEFETNWNSANDMCKLLNINGTTGWRLPDRDELSFMYLNLKQKGLGGFGNDSYWSSTEEHGIFTFTMYHNFGSGLVLAADRLGRGLVSYKVRAVREF